ncbi:MAG: hypothetical protein Q4G00_14780 [Clostridia bacterium]|nr:hypothetical protein [Clostridia bacterium]
MTNDTRKEVHAELVCCLRDHDAVFSDNWFDLHGKQPAVVTLPRQGTLSKMRVEDM